MQRSPVNRVSLTESSRSPKGETSHRQFFFNEGGPANAYSVHYVYAPVEKIEIRIHDEEAGLKNTGLGTFLRLEDGSYRAYATSRSPDEKLMGISVWESRDALEWFPVHSHASGAPLHSAAEASNSHASGAPLRSAAEAYRTTSGASGAPLRSAAEASNFITFENLPGDQSSVAGPTVLPARDGKWLMYFWKHREGHLRYCIAESEDGLRWRVIDFDKPALYHPHDCGLWKLAEGLAREQMIELPLPPEEVLRHKRLWTNDAIDVYYNSHLDRYEAYSVWLHPALPDRRVDVDNAPGIHRLIQRRFSEDGFNFSDAELIMMPDSRDPWDLQFYFLAVQWHLDLMIGMLGYYRVEDGQQSMDTDLCFSRDGYRWQRPLRGGWFPRSEPAEGVMDSCGIYAGSPWIDLGDKWLSIYHATPSPHNSRVYSACMMGATFAKNRFLGVAAGQVPGGFMTEPFFPSKPEVCVDANIRGCLRAEICDAFGRKIPGFHRQNSVPVTGDSESHVLKWNDATIADRLHECFRLRFEFTDGEIYNVAF